MYITDDFSKIVRPTKELKGFRRVFLRADEEKEIRFEITEETLQYYGIDEKLVAENGTFTLSVGLDCTDLQSVQIELTD